MKRTYEIPDPNLKEFKDKIAAIQRRAEALDLEPLSFKVTETLSKETIHKGKKVVMLFHRIEVSGETIRLEGGWHLAGIVDYDQPAHNELGWMIRTVPSEQDFQIPDHFHFDDSRCDHCQIDRYRKHIFLIVNDEGEWMRVGSTCVKDFTSGHDPHRLARMMEYLTSGELADLEHWDIHSGSTTDYLNLQAYLAKVACMIRTFGWVSRSRAHEHYDLQATADATLIEFDDIDTSEQDDELAEAVIDWINADLVEREGLNGYLSDLVRVMTHEAFHQRYAGLVASAVPTYKREVDRADRIERQKKDSEHQGDVGERLDLTLTISKRIDIEIESYRRRGTDILKIHIMEDEDGNVYVWKTTGQKLAEGETYRMRGTIKEHELYNDVKQTVLTRCMKVVHDPCGSDDQWWDDEGWHCGECKSAAN